MKKGFLSILEMLFNSSRKQPSSPFQVASNDISSEPEIFTNVPKCESKKLIPQNISPVFSNEILIKTGDSYVVTDIETTGLSYRSDSIIEISALKVENGNIVDSYSSLIHCDKPLSRKVTDLTGITDTMLHSCDNTLEKVLSEYRIFIGNLPLVGHNINSFDINFINEAYKQVWGIPILNLCIDTLALSKKYLFGPVNYKLQTLANYYKISVYKAHRATDDCMTTNELYKIILSKAPNEENLPGRSSIVCKISLNDIDLQIIKLTQKIFGESEHECFTYKKTGAYLIGECHERMFKIKTSGKLGCYIVFSKQYEADILPKISLRTSAATSSDGGGTTRIFLDDIENDFIALSESILRCYEFSKEELLKIVDYGKGYGMAVRKFFASPDRLKL